MSEYDNQIDKKAIQALNTNTVPLSEYEKQKHRANFWRRKADYWKRKAIEK